MQGPLEWLKRSNLVIQSLIATKAKHPLLSYTKDNMFKLYFFDIGLLLALLDIPYQAIFEELISEFKGFIGENFVAQELFCATEKNNLTAWQEGMSEIEFIIISQGSIIPIEVKTAKRSRRAKSIEVFISKYSPYITTPYLPNQVKRQLKGALETIPIYVCSLIAGS